MKDQSHCNHACTDTEQYISKNSSSNRFLSQIPESYVESCSVESLQPVFLLLVLYFSYEVVYTCSQWPCFIPTKLSIDPPRKCSVCHCTKISVKRAICYDYKDTKKWGAIP